MITVNVAVIACNDEVVIVSDVAIALAAMTDVAAETDVAVVVVAFVDNDFTVSDTIAFNVTADFYAAYYS